MSKTYSLAVVAAIVVSGLAFFGGMIYQKSRDSLAGLTGQDLSKKIQSLGLTSRQSGAGGMMGSGFAGGFAGRGGRGGGTNGDIISKDTQSITVKQQDGSTKVVYISSSTKVVTTTNGSTDDLAVGKTVTATGTPNSDGSVAAQTIQIRPSQSPTQ